jgi:hypothetical protein
MCPSLQTVIARRLEAVRAPDRSVVISRSSNRSSLPSGAKKEPALNRPPCCASRVTSEKLSMGRRVAASETFKTGER